MKKTIQLSSTIIGVILLTFTMNSCKNEPKTEDIKEVTEIPNEVKVENETVENDASFLNEIAEIHLAEIEIGKLAMKKAIRPDVKKYAQMLINDHTKSLEELRALAIKNTITLPTSTLAIDVEKYNELDKKSGTDFDTAFINMMIEGHEKAVNRMTEISQKAKDPDVKLWTSRQVTTFTTHFDEAKKLKEKV
ncbi:MAG: DUF4142 domain-containing protein [Flavobacterium sp.]